MNDLEHFKHIAGDNLFRQWLEKERDHSLRYLVSATDTTVISRAQGIVQLIEKMIQLLDKAKSLR
jgi:hypothetical protein